MDVQGKRLFRSFLTTTIHKIYHIVRIESVIVVGAVTPRATLTRMMAWQ